MKNPHCTVSLSLFLSLSLSLSLSRSRAILIPKSQCKLIYAITLSISCKYGGTSAIMFCHWFDIYWSLFIIGRNPWWILFSWMSESSVLLSWASLRNIVELDCLWGQFLLGGGWDIPNPGSCYLLASIYGNIQGSKYSSLRDRGSFRAVPFISVCVGGGTEDQ